MMTPIARYGIVFWILLIVVVLLVLAPIYWIVATSFKTPTENILPEPTLYPRVFTLRNYIQVVEAGILRNFINSLFVAVTSTVVSLVLSFLAAYALGRHRFPLRLNSVFLIWVLAVKILPPIVLAVPLYTMFTRVGLINNLWGLLIVYQVYTLPYCLWIVFGFIKALPRDFEEAATIDGASRIRVLLSIVLPLTGSGLVATSIFSVIIAWNEFLFALLFIRTPSLQTLPLKIVNFIGEYETLWGELMAIGILATLPILLFSGYVYRRLTSGFSMGLR
jgi:multiple sugar transport system permease protein